MFRYLIASLMVILSITAQAQQTKLLTAEKHNEYGLIYSLPLTALRVEVTATRTVSKAGPYYQYSKKFIGTDKVVKADSEEWIINKVSITPYGVPDRENQYLMQLKPGATTYLCVDEDGMLLAINRQVNLPATAGKGEEEFVSTLQLAPDNEFLQYVNEDFLASQSSAKRAQMLSESLMEIRDSKISLTRGTADTMPTDGRQLELMLQSLEKQEAAITRAFTGYTTSETVTRVFTYLPEDEGRITLFRMSDFAGFVESDDFSGRPVYLSVDLISEGQLPVDVKGEEKKFPKDGVAYCIPGVAKVRLALEDKTLWERELDMSQFGVIFGLNPALFSSKKEPSFAVFNPVTGALKEIGDVE